MQKIIIITGGAGFVGSNLIEYFINKTKLKIISLDNYSSGTVKNHIKSSRVKYIKSNTKKIEIVLNKYKKKINAVFGLSKKTKTIKAKINGIFIKGINFRLENLSTKKPVTNRVIKETIEYAMNDCAKTNIPQFLDSDIKD